MNSRPISDLIFELKNKCTWLEEKIFQETTLTPAEYKAIDVLLPDDSISAAEFAGRMNLSPSRCSRIIEKMMNEGYIVSNAVPGDRRSIHLSLTQSGRNIQKKVKKLLEECNQSIKEKLSQKEIILISQSLQKLLTAMSEGVNNEYRIN